jgi:hypothetical protein
MGEYSVSYQRSYFGTKKWSAASLQLTAEVCISFCYTISVKIRSACVGGSQVAPQQLRRRVHAAAASSAAL